MKRIVMKIGGSILYSGESAIRMVESIIAQQNNAQILLLVGGGDVIEGVRTLHSLYPNLEPENLHWKCIDLLDVTWDIASRLLPFDGRLGEWQSVQELTANRVNRSWIYWVRVGCYYDRVYHQSLNLEHRPALDWRTTTDALAWLLAYRVQADEVLLLKSCTLAGISSSHVLLENGIVDEEFHRLSQLADGPRCHVISINDRATSFPPT